MDQLVYVLLAQDEAHTVPERALVCRHKNEVIKIIIIR